MVVPGFRKSSPLLPVAPSNIPHPMKFVLWLIVFLPHCWSYPSLPLGLLKMLGITLDQPEGASLVKETLHHCWGVLFKC